MTAQEYCIGIDIGGTKTVTGVVDCNGYCLAEDSFPTQSVNSIYDYVERLSVTIKNISEKADVNPNAIGIGAPNGNYHKGTIEHAPNLKWEGIIPLKQLLSEKTGLPVVLTNDANAAAIGEMTFGAAKNMKNFIVVTLGTGLGSGFVVNGELMYGHSGFAGEMGHVMVDPDGRQCTCGHKGCLETYVSATGICRTVTELLNSTDRKSVLRSISLNQLSSKDIFDAAKNKDELAIEVFQYTGKILGLSLANIVAITSPEAIFLLGGLVLSGNLIFEPTLKAFNENLMPIFKNTVKILPSGLNHNMAAVLGAAALCRNANK